MAATARAMDALTGLRHLGVRPDWDQIRRDWAGEDPDELRGEERAETDAWDEHRIKLRQVIEVAILDIGDAELSARLDE